MNVTPERIRELADAIGAAAPSVRVARDPVNQAMINNWVEALGDANPIYVDEGAARAAGHPGLVAPPAMVQVWTMPGLHDRPPADDPMERGINLLTEAGYPAVVATYCEQTYLRYLRHGEHLRMVSELESIVGPKQTALGEGWFVSTTDTWYSGDEIVATMRLRCMKYVAPEDSALAKSPSAPAREDTPASAEHLPQMRIEATPTFIIAAALATRDFQDVHHDRDKARGYGSKDIFLNILADTGLTERFVTDWAGPSARLHSVTLRLLVPCYAYDTLVFSGHVSGVENGVEMVSLVGRGGLGTHVAATVGIGGRTASAHGSLNL